MLTPAHFRVNEAWIAVRINDAFVFVKDDPLSELEPIIGSLKEAFASDFLGNTP